MAELSGKLGEMNFDGLFTDITPKSEVRGKVIRKLDAETVLVRGTVLAMSVGASGDGKLVILGTEAGGDETLVPDCILCDNTVVGTSDDVTASVYTAGCFDPNKVTVKSEYTISAADYDALRKYGIVFKAAAN